MREPSTSLRLAVAALLLLAVPACSGDDQAAPRDAPDASSAQVERAEDVKVRARVTRVAGRLPAKQREAVARRVGRVVHDHLAAAYLGDYPLRRTSAAFADFTPSARKQASRDRDVLTGRGFGAVEQVTLGRAEAYVAVLAPRRHVVGATTRIEVDLRVDTGERTETVRVRGRLLMTPTPDGWRIFGYDLTRSGLAGKSADKANGSKKGRR